MTKAMNPETKKKLRELIEDAWMTSSDLEGLDIEELVEDIENLIGKEVKP